MIIELIQGELSIKTLEKESWSEKDIREVMLKIDSLLVDDLKRLFQRGNLLEIIILEDYKGDDLLQLASLTVLDHNRKFYRPFDLPEIFTIDERVRGQNIIEILIKWNYETCIHLHG